jgi:hypothetical protein
MTERRRERPAPLVLVAVPPEDPSPPFGSYAAVVHDGQRLLAAELSRRLGRLGAAVAPLPAVVPEAGGGGPFHWGRWFVDAARRAAEPEALDAVGYAGSGALALAGDAALELLLSPIHGEVVANNRFSADAFVVAGAPPQLAGALEALETCQSDNAAPRRLAEAGFRVRAMSGAPFTRFDVDTPLDLALLRLAAATHPSARRLDQSVAAFLAMARLPGDRRLEVPHLARIGEVMRDRAGELVVAGRIPASVLAMLETETACRVRAFVEERGMRSAPAGRPRSLLGTLMARSSPADLLAELAGLGDAVIVDSRVLMAAVAGSSRTEDWPAAEERFASDFGDAAGIETGWLRELTEAAAGASVPVLMGAHALVSDGLHVLVQAAWTGVEGAGPASLG